MLGHCVGREIPNWAFHLSVAADCRCTRCTVNYFSYNYFILSGPRAQEDSFVYSFALWPLVVIRLIERRSRFSLSSSSIFNKLASLPHFSSSPLLPSPARVTRDSINLRQSHLPGPVAPRYFLTKCRPPSLGRHISPATISLAFSWAIVLE